jgi:hypothetical protein
MPTRVRIQDEPFTSMSENASLFLIYESDCLIGSDRMMKRTRNWTMTEMHGPVLGAPTRLLI